MVTARVILGDLYVLEASFEVILTAVRWPDRIDLDAPLGTWRESREAFAAAVDAWEWALVDGVFSNLSRVAPMVRIAQPLMPDDVSVVDAMRRQIPPAREIVLRHAARNERELERMVEEISKRRPVTAG